MTPPRAVYILPTTLPSGKQVVSGATFDEILVLNYVRYTLPTDRIAVDAETMEALESAKWIHANAGHIAKGARIAALMDRCYVEPTNG